MTERRSLEIPTWVSEALNRVPLPDAPVGSPWTFAPSALLAPHLPGPLRRVPGLLDRFGAVRLTPQEIGIDTARPVPWRDVVELHTHPLLDVLTIDSSDNIKTVVARLLPPVPFVKKQLVSLGAEKAAEALRALLLLAGAGYAQQAASVQVPVEIVHRSGLWRRRSIMTAGLFSSAVLALPRVAASVLATAQQHEVPIIAYPAAGPSSATQSSTPHGRYPGAALPTRPAEKTSSDSAPGADPAHAG